MWICICVWVRVSLPWVFRYLCLWVCLCLCLLCESVRVCVSECMAVCMGVSQGIYVSTNTGLYMNGEGLAVSGLWLWGQDRVPENKTRHKIASSENPCFSADKALTVPSPLTHTFLPATVAITGVSLSSISYRTSLPGLLPSPGILLLSLALAQNFFKCLIENYKTEFLIKNIFKLTEKGKQKEEELCPRVKGRA